MVTKELIKTEIEKVRDEYLPALYRIVKALEEPGEGRAEIDDERDWKAFVAETYGSLAESPIERGDQGPYEAREPIR